MFVKGYGKVGMKLVMWVSRRVDNLSRKACDREFGGEGELKECRGRN